MNISIIGGTGDMGYGLCLRFAKAGHSIVIGSRHPERAEEAAHRAQRETGCNRITGMENSNAAAATDLVVLSVPSSYHKETVKALCGIIKNKQVLDITIPFAFKPLRYIPPAEGSNALETAAILGENCRVAAGFHTISATLLTALQTPLCGDTLIVGNDAELKGSVIELAQAIGLRAYDAGSLFLAASVESLTPMLIGMNKRYGSNHIGIKLEGI